MIRSTKLKPVDIPQDESLNEKIKALEDQKHQKELLNESKRTKLDESKSPHNNNDLQNLKQNSPKSPKKVSQEELNSPTERKVINGKVVDEPEPQKQSH